jgi:hypothetical protein
MAAAARTEHRGAGRRWCQRVSRCHVSPLCVRGGPGSEAAAYRALPYGRRAFTNGRQAVGSVGDLVRIRQELTKERGVSAGVVWVRALGSG